jgi:lipopolysaccharide transport system ATP-binding protein
MRELVDSGVAVVLVSHDMSTVTQFCSEVLVLNRGKELYRGDPVSAIRRYMALQRDAIEGVKQRAELAATLVGSCEADARQEIDTGWPLSGAFLDTSTADIVGNGKAEFLGVALCSSDGEPTQIFQIGEAADFYYEFRLLEDIAVPIGGVTLVNEINIIVHGKNSMQQKINVPPAMQRGTILRFHQRIILDITPGEYTFVVGLATVDDAIYKNVDFLSHGDLSEHTQRILSVGRAGTITVTFRREGLALPHHGISNLPGDCWFTSLNESNEAFN